MKYAAAASGTADFTLYCISGAAFSGMANSTGANPVGTAALALIKAHGGFPVAATGLGGDGFWVDVTSERVPLRGGYWAAGSQTGVFALAGHNARLAATANLGARPAFVA